MANPEPPERSRSTELTALEARVAALESKFDQYLKEKQQEETRRLRTALLFASGVVTALASFIWIEIIWPVLESVRTDRPQ